MPTSSMCSARGRRLRRRSSPTQSCSVRRNGRCLSCGSPTAGASCSTRTRPSSPSWGGWGCSRSPTMAGSKAARPERRWVWGLLPLLLLAALVVVLLRFGPLGVFQAAVPPVEELTIDRVRLEPGRFVIHVTNGGPAPVTIAQVLVDDAYWQFERSPGPTVPRLGTTTITLEYPWVEGEAHRLKLLS